MSAGDSVPRRWTRQIDIVDMPVFDSIGQFRKPALGHRPMFCFLQSDDGLRRIEIRRRARPREPRCPLWGDALCLKCFQSEPRNQPDVIWRTSFGDAPGECAPEQILKIC